MSNGTQAKYKCEVKAIQTTHIADLKFWLVTTREKPVSPSENQENSSYD